jgi:hypothetical protein
MNTVAIVSFISVIVLATVTFIFITNTRERIVELKKEIKRNKLTMKDNMDKMNDDYYKNDEILNNKITTHRDTIEHKLEEFTDQQYYLNSFGELCNKDTTTRDNCNKIALISELKGDKGDKGDTGITEFNILTNEQQLLLKGDKGDMGRRGRIGRRGMRGIKGDTGGSGVQGERGSKGERGDNGDRGDKGDKGDMGRRGGIWRRGRIWRGR